MIHKHVTVVKCVEYYLNSLFKHAELSMVAKTRAFLGENVGCFGVCCRKTFVMWTIKRVLPDSENLWLPFFALITHILCRALTALQKTASLTSIIRLCILSNDLPRLIFPPREKRNHFIKMGSFGFQFYALFIQKSIR